MKVFVVNLDKNRDRLEYMNGQLKSLGLPYDRFSAINGANLTKQEYGEKYAAWHAELALSRQLVAGEIGCALSHVGVYQRMIENGVPYALVLEDDIELGADFLSAMNRVEEKISKDSAQVFFLSYQGSDSKDKMEFRRLRSASCTDAYVITLPAARAVAEGNYPVVTVADKWGRWSRRYGIELYAVLPVAARQMNEKFATDIDDWANPDRLGGGRRRGFSFVLFKMRRAVDLLLDEMIYRLTGR